MCASVFINILFIHEYKLLDLCTLYIRFAHQILMCLGPVPDLIIITSDGKGL